MSDIEDGGTEGGGISQVVFDIGQVLVKLRPAPIMMLASSKASTRIFSVTGCMMKYVSSTDSPISTRLGGAYWLPSPWRSRKNTTATRVKAESDSSSAGMNGSSRT